MRVMEGLAKPLFERLLKVCHKFVLGCKVGKVLLEYVTYLHITLIMFAFCKGKYWPLIKTPEIWVYMGP